MWTIHAEGDLIVTILRVNKRKLTKPKIPIKTIPEIKI